MKKLPFVSVVLPVRNEEEYIEEALMSLINQDYPKNKYEIIIADGMSTDRTVEIIKKIKRKYKRPKIRIYENKKITTASGRNLATKKAKGKYIFSYSGHGSSEKNYIFALVRRIEKTNNNIAGVGCPFLPKWKNLQQRLIGMFMKSRFYAWGNKSYRFWTLKKEKYVNGLSFGCFKKNIIKEYLPKDELTVGDDATLSAKLRNANYKLLLTPKTMAYFYPRKNLIELFKQQVEFLWFKLRK